MVTTTTIPIPATPFLDTRNGSVSRAWYLFFQNLFLLTGSGQNTISLDDLQLAPVEPDEMQALVDQLQSALDAIPVAREQEASHDPLTPTLSLPEPANDVTPVSLPVTGASGTFTTVDLKTVTVLNGIIASIV